MIKPENDMKPAAAAQAENGPKPESLPRRVLSAVKAFFAGLDSRGVTNVWVGCIVAIGVLVWWLCPREALTMEAVNKILLDEGETWRLEAPVRGGPWRTRGPRLGAWYSVRPAFVSDDGAAEAAALAKKVSVIFPLLQDGITSPCLVLCGPGGNVEKVIPLSPDAAALVRADAAAARFARDRIEKAAPQALAALSRQGGREAGP